MLSRILWGLDEGTLAGLTGILSVLTVVLCCPADVFRGLDTADCGAETEWWWVAMAAAETGLTGTCLVGLDET